jgi:hypothetical protein
MNFQCHEAHFSGWLALFSPLVLVDRVREYTVTAQRRRYQSFYTGHYTCHFSHHRSGSLLANINVLLPVDIILHHVGTDDVKHCLACHMTFKIFVEQ